jgi:hypothetical protein
LTSQIDTVKKGNPRVGEKPATSCQPDKFESPQGGEFHTFVSSDTKNHRQQVDTKSEQSLTQLSALDCKTRIGFISRVPPIKKV